MDGITTPIFPVGHESMVDLLVQLPGHGLQPSPQLPLVPPCSSPGFVPPSRVQVHGGREGQIKLFPSRPGTTIGTTGQMWSFLWLRRGHLPVLADRGLTAMDEFDDLRLLGPWVFLPGRSARR